MEEAAFTNMDRRVKERLVGAAILVAIVVLIAPELLSGPRPEQAPAPVALHEPLRSYTVDLGDNSAAAHPVETPGVGASAATSAAGTPNVPAAGASAAAIGAAGAAVSGVVARAPLGTSAAPTDAAAASRLADQIRRPAAPLRTAGQNGWWVQLGSFANQTNAQKLVHELQEKGFSVSVLSSGVGRRMRHRVRVGPLADREAAMQTAAKLKAQGHLASVVPPAV